MDPKTAITESMTQNFGPPRPEEIYTSIPVQPLMQTKTRYSTAVSVVRPRSLRDVERRCIEEASIAGSDFYYSWAQGGETISGLSVSAAQAMARNFGNCVVESTVAETPSAYIFSAAFIDLETGFNISRDFRQNKKSPKSKSGKDIYTGDRGADIIFQIGQSKAIRNVILNAMPSWLVSKVHQKAKENISEKITRMGVKDATARILKKADSLRIPLANIEYHYGRSSSWDVETLIKISSGIRAIENGYDDISSVFPLDAPSAARETRITVTPPEETPQQKTVGIELVNKETGEIITGEATLFEETELTKPVNNNKQK